MISAARARRVLQYLPTALRGRPLHGAERYAPFFIVGSGRCGSTLLRAILEAHPDVHIPPENPLGTVIRDYRRFSRLPWNALLRVVLGAFEFRPWWDEFDLSLRPLFQQLDALPPASRHLAGILDALYRAHAHAHKPTATRWGDKTPGNTFSLNAITGVFPDLKTVHLVRDGRDVVESFARSAPQQPLAESARHWLHAVAAARAFGVSHPAQYLEVHYEDLVRDPRTTVGKVATFLGVGFDERMLRHHEADSPLSDLDGRAYHERVREPINAAAVGRWRSTFDPAHAAELERLLGPTLASLGYGEKPRG